LDTYKNNNIITISPSATNPELTKSGKYPNFFRTIASDDTQALTSESVQTPLGNISFDERGDATGAGFSIYQVRNNTFVELK